MKTKPKTVNQVSPAFTHYIEKNWNQIQKVAKQHNPTLLIKTLEETVEPAMTTYISKNGRELPTKKVRFLKTINSPKMFDNEKIMDYVYNSLHKAKITVAKYQ